MPRVIIFTRVPKFKEDATEEEKRERSEALERRARVYLLGQDLIGVEERAAGRHGKYVIDPKGKSFVVHDPVAELIKELAAAGAEIKVEEPV